MDLHTHSTASDGSDTPEALVGRAASEGIRILALSDHDTLDGLASFLAAAGQAGILAVPAVELSTELDGHELHVVALGLRSERRGPMAGFLEQIRDWRRERNERMAERLTALGRPITVEEVEKVAGGRIVARPHFALVMQRKGHVATMAEAFERFIGLDRPGYVPKRKPTPAEVVAAVRQTGALVVVAHPNSLAERGRNVEEQLLHLLPLGIDAVEAWHPNIAHGLTGRIRRFAAAHGLLVSGGSDYHGRFKEHTWVGRTAGGRGLMARDVAPLLERLAEAGLMEMPE